MAEVFSQVCQLIELRETDYFGLALLQGNESCGEEMLSSVVLV